MTNVSAPVKALLTLPTDRSFRVERIFNASRDRVWRAYSDPAQLAQWWGRGNPVDVKTFEFRKGGHWRFEEHAGGQTHGFEGRFGEIVAPERMTQTFEWDGMPTHVILSTTTFEDLGDGRTKIVAESMFMTAADRDGMMQSGMEGGMNESYAALDRLLAAQS